MKRKDNVSVKNTKNINRKKAGCVLLSGVLTLALACGILGGNSMKSAAQEAEEEKEDQATVENLATERIGSLLNNKSGEGKEETVYIFTDSTGITQKIVVNEKLNNSESSDLINDTSQLKDILNLSGDEEYSLEDGKMVWDAKGNSITYQGTSDQKAPVDINVTYKLDGKEISAEELHGKSGHVTIRFDYTNNEARTITVNGKESEAYVPFTVVTSMLLSNDHFSNITVENGEASRLTTGTMVMGVVLPGLNDSLQKTLNGSEFKLDLGFPDYVVVDADTDNCEIDLILSVAGSNLVNVDSLDDISLDNMEEKLEELQSATEDLSNGADELANGSKKLWEGSTKLESGAKDLYDGTTALATGVDALDDGATKLSEGLGEVKTGSGSLSTGANELSAGASSLATGAEAVSSGVNNLVDAVSAMPQSILASEKALYDQANASLAALGISVDFASDHASMSTASIDAAISNVKSALSGAAAQYQAAYSRVTANGGSTFDAQDTAAAVKALMASQNLGQVTAEATISGMIAAAEAEIAGGATSSSYYTQLNALAAGYYQSAASQAGSSEAVDSLQQLKGAVSALYGVEASMSSIDTASLDALKNGAGSVASGAATLSDGSEALATGAAQLDKGIEQVQNGLGELSGGIGTLADGAASLNDGAGALYKGTVDLNTGAGNLYSGMTEMQSGVSEFKTEGIDKISELTEDDAATLVDKMKEIIKLGNSYQSFAGKPDEMEGSVVFIYRMPGIN
ncbi:MAG: hypothetical protein MJ107_08860 [Lachnospiraceae bacterium]|nr:hypothetical protein [Lachnospiraceae bacterium]